MDNVKKERPEIAEKINKNFGFAMGIEFRQAIVVAMHSIVVNDYG